MPKFKDKGIGPALNMAKLTPEGVTSRFEITQNIIKAKNSTEYDRNVAVIDIEGPIGWEFEKWWNDEPQDTTGKVVRDKIAEINALNVDEIKVNIIESPGGVIEDGIAIYEALRKQEVPVTTEVIGYAASMATTIMLAGDVRKVSANAVGLDHSAMVPMPYHYMNSTELRTALDEAEMLDRRINAIKEKHGVDLNYTKPFREADNGNGKWMNAEELVEAGLATEIFEPYSQRAVASVNIDKFKAVAKTFGLPKLPPQPKNVQVNGQEPINHNADNKEEPFMALSAEDKQDIAEIFAQGFAAMNKTKEDATVQTPAAPAKTAQPVNEVEVAFEGDPTNQEDLDNHVKKIEMAQLKQATNFNDIDSVRKYQKAVNEVMGRTASKANPSTNSSLVQDPIKPEGNDEKAINKKDTREAMKAINKRDNKEG